MTHSRRVLKIAEAFGWLPGARYTNLRDVRSFERLGFLDIDWRDYSFKKHVEAARATRPLLTVARDLFTIRSVDRVLDEAAELAIWAERVIVVPKTLTLADSLADDRLFPSYLLIGYSVPTRYGGTRIPPEKVRRPVHLLGGRPDVQRRLAQLMPVVSIDCNRFTLDAAFGDFFDGVTFRPHPRGGFSTCIRESLRNINSLWNGYKCALPQGAPREVA